jgi:hypothetical protein
MSTYHAMNPFKWHEKIKTYNHHRSRNEELSHDDRSMGELASQSYNPIPKRKSFGNYQYQEDKSGHDYAVYHNPTQKKSYLVFKGTSDANDVIPDLSILLGYQSSHNSFQNALDLYDQLKKEKNDHEWEVVGHSLGGAKAMYVAERKGINSHAFNPGYNNYLDEDLDPSYKGHHLYVRKGDPVSNTILTENLANSKILPSLGYSALANHSIGSFRLKDAPEEYYDYEKSKHYIKNT